MADFEDFLIAEFNEQHNTMRQIETSMTQMILGFFSVEGIVVAGGLSLLSINVSTNVLITLAAPIFWFLFLFGHLTYGMAIYSFTNIVTIDFQNAIARTYFSAKYDNREYLFFLLDPEAITGGSPGEWERVKDSRAVTAKFVGTVNIVNLICALATSIYAIVDFYTHS